MRTLLKRFSGDFNRSFKPLLQPLEAVLDGLGNPTFAEAATEALPLLQDVHHQIDKLVEKIENQHAFVLIFGPLKSGKSTLMNALAGAYVSEVSSLPGYPCLVYVGDGKERTFEVTRYNGRTQSARDSAALQRMVDHDHGRLASAIRSAEERGEDFEPSQHFPEAIRCIDVRLPATGLAESGSILVDTPGLYSRMKFGYDRMTRDFRNSAACAVFVVKADNLFLEQVFDEFNELLDLFSRIFLIVNIDTTKRDLGAHGELVPSLEQSEPLRIVGAFEDFVMSAPLKAAVAEGHLRIYPIDLLRCAQRSLRAADGEPQEQEEATVDGQDVSFDDFQNDLTEFLNSDESLTAFMTDNLHRGETLMEDMRKVMENQPEVTALRTGLREIETEFENADQRLEAGQRLLKNKWQESFGELEAGLSETVRGHAEKASIKVLASLQGLLMRWFDEDSSLAALCESLSTPLLQKHREDLVRFAREAIEAQNPEQPFVGLNLDRKLAHDVATIEFPMGAIAEGALEAAAGNVGRARPGPLFSPENIPVRKGFFDWIFFRSLSTIRRKLFGTPQPDRIISRHEKQRRLGPNAVDAMKTSLDAKARTHLLDLQNSVEKSLVRQYVTLLGERVEEGLHTHLDELAKDRAHWETQTRTHRRILGLFDRLQERSSDARSALRGLQREYLAEGPQLHPQEQPRTKPTGPAAARL